MPAGIGALATTSKTNRIGLPPPLRAEGLILANPCRGYLIKRRRGSNAAKTGGQLATSENVLYTGV